MGTVNKTIADNIAKHNGYIDGDDNNDMGDNPRVMEITEYDNAFGGKGYGLTMDGQSNVYKYPTQYINNPRCYWKYQEKK